MITKLILVLCSLSGLQGQFRGPAVFPPAPPPTNPPTTPPTTTVSPTSTTSTTARALDTTTLKPTDNFPAADLKPNKISSLESVNAKVPLSALPMVALEQSLASAADPLDVTSVKMPLKSNDLNAPFLETAAKPQSSQASPLAVPVVQKPAIRGPSEAVPVTQFVDKMERPEISTGQASLNTPSVVISKKPVSEPIPLGPFEVPVAEAKAVDFKPVLGSRPHVHMTVPSMTAIKTPGIPQPDFLVKPTVTLTASEKKPNLTVAKLPSPLPFTAKQITESEHQGCHAADLESLRTKLFAKGADVPVHILHQLLHKQGSPTSNGFLGALAGLLSFGSSSPHASLLKGSHGISPEELKALLLESDGHKTHIASGSSFFRVSYDIDGPFLPQAASGHVVSGNSGSQSFDSQTFVNMGFIPDGSEEFVKNGERWIRQCFIRKLGNMPSKETGGSGSVVVINNRPLKPFSEIPVREHPDGEIGISGSATFFEPQRPSENLDIKWDNQNVQQNVLNVQRPVFPKPPSGPPSDMMNGFVGNASRQTIVLKPNSDIPMREINREITPEKPSMDSFSNGSGQLIPIGVPASITPVRPITNGDKLIYNNENIVPSFPPKIPVNVVAVPGSTVVEIHEGQKDINIPSKPVEIIREFVDRNTSGQIPSMPVVITERKETPVSDTVNLGGQTDYMRTPGEKVVVTRKPEPNTGGTGTETGRVPNNQEGFVQEVQRPINIKPYYPEPTYGFNETTKDSRNPFFYPPRPNSNSPGGGHIWIGENKREPYHPGNMNTVNETRINRYPESPRETNEFGSWQRWAPTGGNEWFPDYPEDTFQLNGTSNTRYPVNYLPKRPVIPARSRDGWESSYLLHDVDDTPQTDLYQPEPIYEVEHVEHTYPSYQTPKYPRPSQNIQFITENGFDIPRGTDQQKIDGTMTRLRALHTLYPIYPDHRPNFRFIESPERTEKFWTSHMNRTIPRTAYEYIAEFSEFDVPKVFGPLDKMPNADVEEVYTRFITLLNQRRPGLPKPQQDEAFRAYLFKVFPMIPSQFFVKAKTFLTRFQVKPVKKTPKVYHHFVKWNDPLDNMVKEVDFNYLPTALQEKFRLHQGNISEHLTERDEEEMRKFSIPLSEVEEPFEEVVQMPPQQSYITRERYVHYGGQQMPSWSTSGKYGVPEFDPRYWKEVAFNKTIFDGEEEYPIPTGNGRPSNRPSGSTQTQTVETVPKGEAAIHKEVAQQFPQMVSRQPIISDGTKTDTIKVMNSAPSTQTGGETVESSVSIPTSQLDGRQNTERIPSLGGANIITKPSSQVIRTEKEITSSPVQPIRISGDARVETKTSDGAPSSVTEIRNTMNTGTNVQEPNTGRIIQSGSAATSGSFSFSTEGKTGINGGRREPTQEVQTITSSGRSGPNALTGQQTMDREVNVIGNSIEPLTTPKTVNIVNKKETLTANSVFNQEGPIVSGRRDKQTAVENTVKMSGNTGSTRTQEEGPLGSIGTSQIIRGSGERQSSKTSGTASFNNGGELELNTDDLSTGEETDVTSFDETTINSGGRGGVFNRSISQSGKDIIATGAGSQNGKGSQSIKTGINSGMAGFTSWGTTSSNGAVGGMLPRAIQNGEEDEYSDQDEESDVEISGSEMSEGADVRSSTFGNGENVNNNGMSMSFFSGSSSKQSNGRFGSVDGSEASMNLEGFEEFDGFNSSSAFNKALALNGSVNQFAAGQKGSSGRREFASGGSGSFSSGSASFQSESSSDGMEGMDEMDTAFEGSQWGSSGMSFGSRNGSMSGSMDLETDDMSSSQFSENSGFQSTGSKNGGMSFGSRNGSMSGSGSMGLETDEMSSSQFSENSGFQSTGSKNGGMSFGSRNGSMSGSMDLETDDMSSSQFSENSGFQSTGSKNGEISFGSRNGSMSGSMDLETDDMSSSQFSENSGFQSTGSKNGGMSFGSRNGSMSGSMDLETDDMSSSQFSENSGFQSTGSKNGEISFGSRNGSMSGSGSMGLETDEQSSSQFSASSGFQSNNENGMMASGWESNMEDGEFSGSRSGRRTNATSSNASAFDIAEGQGEEDFESEYVSSNSSSSSSFSSQSSSDSQSFDEFASGSEMESESFGMSGSSGNSTQNSETQLEGFTNNNEKCVQLNQKCNPKQKVLCCDKNQECVRNDIDSPEGKCRVKRTLV